MIHKISHLLFFLTISPILFLGKTPDSLAQSFSKMPDKECFITFTTIGGYSGYSRNGYLLQQEETGIKLQIFLMPFDTDSMLTEYDEQGRISNYRKPNLLIEERFIPNDAADGMEKALMRLDSLGQQTNQDFDAELYCFNRGGCTNMGGWAHYKSSSKSFYVFGRYPLASIESSLNSIKPIPAKTKRKFFSKKKK